MYRRDDNPIKDECNIDESISKYIDEKKIKNMNRKLKVTKEQCENLQGLGNKTPIIICSNLGGSGKIVSFGKKDISNAEQCTDACNDMGGTWMIGPKSKQATCNLPPRHHPSATPAPTPSATPAPIYLFNTRIK